MSRPVGILPRRGRGTARSAVEGASDRARPLDAPTTMLRMVPLPLRGRIGGAHG